MFVSIGETTPPPSPNQFCFFNDDSGDMRSVGMYGNVAAAVAAALGDGSGVPKVKDHATRFIIDTGSQATCINDFRSFGVTHKTTPRANSARRTHFSTAATADFLRSLT